MSTCQQCGAPVAFSAVLNTINPFKIKCKQCKRPILLKKVSTSFVIFLIFAAVLFLITSFDIVKQNLVYFALPLAFCVEVLYFFLIRKRVIKIKSNILG